MQKLGILNCLCGLIIAHIFLNLQNVALMAIMHVMGLKFNSVNHNVNLSLVNKKGV